MSRLSVQTEPDRSFKPASLTSDTNATSECSIGEYVYSLLVFSDESSTVNCHVSSVLSIITFSIYLFSQLFSFRTTVRFTDPDYSLIRMTYQFIRII
jgi:hypothetical protein